MVTYYVIIFVCFKNVIHEIFPSILRHPSIAAAFKKDTKNSNKNYRPVSI